MRDEHSIGGGGEYCGGNNAQLGHIREFYSEASSGKYLPRAALFNLEPGVISAVCTSPLGELLRPGSLVNQKRGKQMGHGPPHKGVARILLNPLYSSGFVVNSEARNGARPSIRVRVVPGLSRSVLLRQNFVKASCF
jgi:hypothetical protein